MGIVGRPSWPPQRFFFLLDWTIVPRRISGTMCNLQWKGSHMCAESDMRADIQGLVPRAGSTFVCWRVLRFCGCDFDDATDMRAFVPQIGATSHRSRCSLAFVVESAHCVHNCFLIATEECRQSDMTMHSSWHGISRLAVSLILLCCASSHMQTPVTGWSAHLYCDQGTQVGASVRVVGVDHHRTKQDGSLFKRSW